MPRSSCRRNSVGAEQLKKGAVTGSKIDLASLGTVPSAASAQTLGGLTAAQISEASKLRCPDGMKLGGRACVEEAERAPKQLLLAMLACGFQARGELTGYEMRYFTASPPQDSVGAATLTLPFRCATAPSS
jgi:hypothetical protein